MASNNPGSDLWGIYTPEVQIKFNAQPVNNLTAVSLISLKTFDGSGNVMTNDSYGGGATDTDGDGTPDASDGCPNDANKVAAGACGCGVADTDTDGDGTADCNDACPNDPNKTAAGNCGCGEVEQTPCGGATGSGLWEVSPNGNIYHDTSYVGIGLNDANTSTKILAPLHIAGHEDAVLWPLIVNNRQNQSEVTGYGAGIKLKLSTANSSVEEDKWSGIAVVQETSWGNGSGLALYTDTTEKVRIDYTGNVGIGTASPDAKLDVKGRIKLQDAMSIVPGNNSYPGINLYSYENQSVHPTLIFHNYGGTPSTPSATSNGTPIGVMSFTSHDGVKSVHNARIAVYAADNYSVGNTPANMKFLVGGLDSSSICCGTQRMIIQGSTGYVGIGAETPQYKLDVDGNINASGYLLNGSNLISAQNGGIVIGNTNGDISGNSNNHLFIGQFAGNGSINGATENTFIGYSSGKIVDNDSSINNVLLGAYSGANLNYSRSNTAIGHSALQGVGSTETDNVAYNVAVGLGAGRNVKGNSNVFVGYASGYDAKNGWNTFVGYHSGRHNSQGSFNSFLGHAAGEHSTGSGNVFLGDRAGQYETGNRKLYLSSRKNGVSLNLVYGNFETGKVFINPISDAQGVVTSQPVEALDVNGALRIGAAENANEGTIQYDTTAGQFLGYTPEGWVSLGGNGVGGNSMWALDSSNHATLDTSLVQQVTIGNGNVSDYDLVVNGKIATKAIVVNLQGDFPDYVFSPSYDLMPLDSLADFIQENQHLPNVPSAEEVSAQGMDLAEMQRLQMEKLEELTLYLLQQKEEIERLKAELAALKND